MRYLKFMTLVCAVTMLICGVGCMVWRSWWLGVACAIVSAYAWGMCFELYKAQIVHAILRQSENESSH